MEYVTEAARSLIGTESDLIVSEPLSEDALRRFVQAVMEDDPVHWDEEVAADSKYGAVVAPPLYVLHAQRAPSTGIDPFDRFVTDPEWDGALAFGSLASLPEVPVPFNRILNGGTEATFFRLPKVGDVIQSKSTYVDIQERTGRSGPMAIVKVRTTYTNGDGDLLAEILNSFIRR